MHGLACARAAPTRGDKSASRPHSWPRCLGPPVSTGARCARLERARRRANTSRVQVHSCRSPGSPALRLRAPSQRSRRSAKPASSPAHLRAHLAAAAANLSALVTARVVLARLFRAPPPPPPLVARRSSLVAPQNRPNLLASLIDLPDWLALFCGRATGGLSFGGGARQASWARGKASGWDARLATRKWRAKWFACGKRVARELQRLPGSEPSRAGKLIAIQLSLSNVSGPRQFAQVACARASS